MKATGKIAPPRTANTYPYSLGRVSAVISSGFAVKLLTKKISKCKLSESVRKFDSSLVVEFIPTASNHLGNFFVGKTTKKWQCCWLIPAIYEVSRNI